ncbi:MAG: hypothetical protein WC307_06045 [Candidatus Nanoarchaeia archaeon]|jgi:transcription initiation factor IIE alpha subunit
MSKCPKCKQEINYLNNYQSGENHYRLDADGEYELIDFINDDKTNDFECPLCNEVIFTSEDKAYKFLRGKKKKTVRC